MFPHFAAFLRIAAPIHADSIETYLLNDNAKSVLAMKIANSSSRTIFTNVVKERGRLLRELQRDTK